MNGGTVAAKPLKLIRYDPKQWLWIRTRAPMHLVSILEHANKREAKNVHSSIGNELMFGLVKLVGIII